MARTSDNTRGGYAGQGAIPENNGCRRHRPDDGLHVHTELRGEEATELIETAKAKGVKLGAAAATMLSPINW